MVGEYRHTRLSHRPEGGGSTATEEPGGGLVPINADWDASALILLAFEPPYLPALGGRTGTFPPFGFRLWGNSRSLRSLGRQVGPDRFY